MTADELDDLVAKAEERGHPTPSLIEALLDNAPRLIEALRASEDQERTIMTNEERIAALEAKVFGKPESQPEPIDPDLAEAKAYADREWGGLDDTQGNYAAEKAYYAALKSRPKPCGEVVAWIYDDGEGSWELIADPSSIFAINLVRRGYTRKPLYTHPDPRVADKTHHCTGCKERHDRIDELTAQLREQAMQYLALDGQATEALEKIAAMKAAGNKVAYELRRLKAIVRGECSSLLDDDDGGTPPELNSAAALIAWSAIK